MRAELILSRDFKIFVTQEEYVVYKQVDRFQWRWYSFWAQASRTDPGWNMDQNFDSQSVEKIPDSVNP